MTAPVPRDARRVRAQFFAIGLVLGLGLGVFLKDHLGEPSSRTVEKETSFFRPTPLASTEVLLAMTTESGERRSWWYILTDAPRKWDHEEGGLRTGIDGFVRWGVLQRAEPLATTEEGLSAWLDRFLRQVRAKMDEAGAELEEGAPDTGLHPFGVPTQSQSDGKTVRDAREWIARVRFVYHTDAIDGELFFFLHATTDVKPTLSYFVREQLRRPTGE
jgi:hypothetical protein